MIYDTHIFTNKDLRQLQEDPFFSPLVTLIKKFGTNYDDGSVKINLRKPVMPNPQSTKWDKLPFNEGDNLIDLIWDLFLKHGEGYKLGEEVFDSLRVHIPCIKFTQAEKDFIMTAISAYRSDYEGISGFPDNGLNVLESIQKKLAG